MEHRKQEFFSLLLQSFNLHITSKQRESREKGWLTKKENVWEKIMFSSFNTKKKSRLFCRTNRLFCGERKKEMVGSSNNLWWFNHSPIIDRSTSYSTSFMLLPGTNLMPAHDVNFFSLFSHVSLSFEAAWT